MRKYYVIGLFALCVLMMSVSAHAQTAAGARNVNQVDNPLGDCSGAATADQCMSTNWGEPQAITFCLRNDGCWMCNLINDRCVLVKVMDGGCTCDDVPVKGSPGITWCNPKGTCKYAA